MTTGKIRLAEYQGMYVFKFLGDIRLTLCAALDEAIKPVFESSTFRTLVIDLSEAEALDSTTLGFIAKLAKLTQQRTQQMPMVVGPNPDLCFLLKSMGLDQVVNIMACGQTTVMGLSDLPVPARNQGEIRDQVIEAHQHLIQLNESNRIKFQDLVHSLENHHEKENL